MKTISLFYGDTEYEVTGRYTKGHPAVMYLRNGDPGYPEEPPEFEIEDVKVGGQSILALLECCWFDNGRKGLTHLSVLEEFENLCLEKIED